MIAFWDWDQQKFSLALPVIVLGGSPPAADIESSGWCRYLRNCPTRPTSSLFTGIKGAGNLTHTQCTASGREQREHSMHWSSSTQHRTKRLHSTEHITKNIMWTNRTQSTVQNAIQSNDPEHKQWLLASVKHTAGTIAQMHTIQGTSVAFTASACSPQSLSNQYSIQVECLATGLLQVQTLVII